VNCGEGNPISPLLVRERTAQPEIRKSDMMPEADVKPEG